jgi:hypothetical protein
VIKPGDWDLIKMNEELTEHLLFNFNTVKWLTPLCRKNATAVTYKWKETDNDYACGRLGAGCEELSWSFVNEFRDSACF